MFGHLLDTKLFCGYSESRIYTAFWHRQAIKHRIHTFMKHTDLKQMSTKPSNASRKATAMGTHCSGCMFIMVCVQYVCESLWIKAYVKWINSQYSNNNGNKRSPIMEEESIHVYNCDHEHYQDQINTFHNFTMLMG